MKQLRFSLFLIVPVIMACSDGSTEETATAANGNTTTTTEDATTNNTPALEPTETQNSNLPERKDACDLATVEQIAAIMGWNAAEVEHELMMRLEDYDITLCRYYTPTGESVQARISWKSEAAQDNKVLETQFDDFLANGSNGFTYETFDAMGNGTAALLGKNAARGYYYHHFKQRYNNTVELSVEITETNDDADVSLQKLNALVALYD